MARNQTLGQPLSSSSCSNVSNYQHCTTLGSLHVLATVVCHQIICILLVVPISSPCSFSIEQQAMMGMQDAGIRVSQTGSFFQYQRLEQRDEGAARHPRRRWLPSLTGKAAVCSCFFTLRKLKWSRITSVLLSRKVPEPSSKICHDTDEVCPTIIFLSQWGLPVLPCPSRARGSKGKHAHLKGF